MFPDINKPWLIFSVFCMNDFQFQSFNGKNMEKWTGKNSNILFSKGNLCSFFWHTRTFERYRCRHRWHEEFDTKATKTDNGSQPFSHLCVSHGPLRVTGVLIIPWESGTRFPAQVPWVWRGGPRRPAASRLRLLTPHTHTESRTLTPNLTRVKSPEHFYSF